ncbi:ABC transporter ATP-binding protein [Photobacterium sanctipauli]|uniref:ABC transporter ATP-binding protein n=1 Tax=Photobacterium sanctipauli TaxID=1342794 RepID=A0A2T3NYG7_9GAMM|nr:ATP-binding cassette domain-containing protein [Photobacterium sanctipauli]PSW21311.1 ABC transporter ATP-binding protein [Photobacterium sanctipauli]
MTLSVENLTINNQAQPLFAPVSFTIQPGEVVALMGPSGCGKSTLLSVIAGHLSAAFNFQGTVQLEQRDVLSLTPDQRNIGIVFQDDLLFPHLTIRENLIFGIPKSHDHKLRITKANQTLAALGLSALADKMPNEVSGGQRARISLMRMLLSEPKAVLLDEPFSKLDKALRQEFREFVFEQIAQRKIPALMVTHDDDDIPPNGRVMRWPWHNAAQHQEAESC